MPATWKKDLRAGKSVWQSRRLEKIVVQSLCKDARADVLIIGAGISGAMIADALSAEGLQVLIVDRRGAVLGSTPASTALLQYEIDTPLTHLSKQIGKTRAERIWRRSRLAVDSIRERARALNLNADLVNRDSLYLEGTVLDEAALRAEHAARRNAGFEVACLSATEVKARFHIDGRSAILGYDNMTADPRRLAAGFLRAAQSRGARIAAPIEIDRIESDDRGVHATTTEGIIIGASHLVFASGYELPKGVPKKNLSIASTWALATFPQPRRLWPEQCVIWEASDPYLYLRADPFGRIICGGEDEEFEDAGKRDALMAEKIEAVRAKLTKMMPWVDTTPEYSWCANFGASSTGTPSIGPVPKMKHCYAALGYGGNGITFSMIAAQILRAAIGGEEDCDADLFSFTRSF